MAPVFRIRPLYGAPTQRFGRIDANCRERQLSCDATLVAIRILLGFSHSHGTQRISLFVGAIGWT